MNKKKNKSNDEVNEKVSKSNDEVNEAKAKSNDEVNEVQEKEEKEEVNENIKILWHRDKEDEEWKRYPKYFKSEVSANNHNIFMTGFKFTKVLSLGEKPE